jgi:hypothetical protein
VVGKSRYAKLSPHGVTGGRRRINDADQFGSVNLAKQPRMNLAQVADEVPHWGYERLEVERTDVNVIDAAGRVSADLHEGSEDESVVRQVGELFHLVLADSSFPVPLRLVITQATSTPPFYASLAALSGKPLIQASTSALVAPAG